MTTWFTSDLHIGHALVARERAIAFGAPLLTNRSEDAIPWHDQRLAWNWGNLVHPTDQIWVLGDVSCGGKTAMNNALQWVSERPGIKHLISGNHDACHPMHRDAHKWQEEYLKVFVSVQPFARRRIAGKDILLSHFPYFGDHTDEDRFDQYRLRDKGLPLLHGHTHSDKKVRYHPTQIHVGLDAWGLHPVQLDEVAELLEEK